MSDALTLIHFVGLPRDDGVVEARWPSVPRVGERVNFGHFGSHRVTDVEWRWSAASGGPPIVRIRMGKVEQ